MSELFSPAPLLFRPSDIEKYSPDQARDDHGRWSETGAGGGTSSGASGAAQKEIKLLPTAIHDGKPMTGAEPSGAIAPTAENTSIDEASGDGEGEKASTPVASRPLLGIDTNTKTVKGQKQGFATAIMYLAPAKESGVMNTCAYASKYCEGECLKASGRMIMNAPARKWKTQALKDDPKAFIDRLDSEISKLEKVTNDSYKIAGKDGKLAGMHPTVRLNGTSDLPWQNVKGSDGKNLMEKHPNVQFYDYTKNPNQIALYEAGKLPPNYHLTFSRSEENDPSSKVYDPKKGDVDKVLAGGKTNVAIVFDTPTTRVKESNKDKYPGKKVGDYINDLPQTYKGYPVLDGDLSDLRFTDPKGGHVVGLRGKGNALHEEQDDKAENHFVIPINTLPGRDTGHAPATSVISSDKILKPGQKPPKRDRNVTVIPAGKLKKPGAEPGGFVNKRIAPIGMARILSQDPNLVAASHRWMPNDAVCGEE